MISPYIPYAVAIVLIAASVIDMRSGRIPNWASYALFALFILLVATSPDPAAFGWQLGFAAIVFGLGLALYAFVGVGAGAVKLLFGAALFLPPSRWVVLVLVLIGTTFALGLLVQLIRGGMGKETSKWKVMRERIMPLSLPITATALLGMFWLQA